MKNYSLVLPAAFTLAPRSLAAAALTRLTFLPFNPNCCPHMIQLTPTQLRQAADIQEEIQELQGKLSKILGGEVPTPSQAKAPKKRKMSAAGRKAIGDAAKARWAKYNAAKGEAKSAKKAKKMISAAGIARIRAAQKARWAKIKAAKA
jgi:hypothetical protein